MADETLRVEVPSAGPVTALRTTAEARPSWLFVYAPGAGSNLNDPFGAFAARRLAGDGVETVRFQFPYMEAGKRGPDRAPVLEATWRAVIEAVRDPSRRLVVGGRSMGGRIGSLVVAQGAAVDALALFAYPLHQPGRPGNVRDEHFPSIHMPVLFCSGTRDSFGSPEELRQAARKLKRSTVHFLEGADHGYAVRKSSGRTREDVWEEAAGTLADFLGRL